MRVYTISVPLGFLGVFGPRDVHRVQPVDLLLGPSSAALCSEQIRSGWLCGERLFLVTESLQGWTETLDQLLQSVDSFCSSVVGFTFE